MIAVTYMRWEDETGKAQVWGRKGKGKGGSARESRIPPPPTHGRGIRNALYSNSRLSVQNFKK